VSTGADIQVAPGYKADVLIRWGGPVLPGAPIFEPLAQSAPAQRVEGRVQQ
jgi:secreted PhoX family phosphatase